MNSMSPPLLADRTAAERIGDLRLFGSTEALHHKRGGRQEGGRTGMEDESKVSILQKGNNMSNMFWVSDPTKKTMKDRST